jgi:LssY C-terminus
MHKVPQLSLSDRRHQKKLLRYGIALLGALVGCYGLVAYIILPKLWAHYEHNPKLEHSPKTTQTREGIPGDPLNVGLVGTKDEVIRALLAAGWYPADPITFSSSLGIAKSVLLKRPYPTAPVSNLYLLGRKQDLAFELPVGNSAKQRHHVRLWQSKDLGSSGQPLWLGSCTFDLSVELSRYTKQITHHINGDIDAERDTLIQNLQQAKQLVSIYQVTGVGANWQGKNGGGDKYYTDGEITVGVISSNNVAQTTPPKTVANPPAVEMKNKVWSWIKHLGKS